MRTNPLNHLLRTAALSAALIACGAATALADVPGSYFPDEWRPKPVLMQAAQAAAQNSCRMADAGMPALAASLGRAATNHLPPSAAHARSTG
jgi:hypothetical protein